MPIDINNSLLNDVSTKDRCRTFPELSSGKGNHTQLDCGQNRFKKFSPTLIIKNVGSTARDNFSIERNFLSCLRLSMMLIFVGMAFYFRFEITTPALPSHGYYSSLLGLFFFFLGNFMLLWALLNYLQFQSMLAKYIIVENGLLQYSVVAIVGITIFVALFNV